MLEKQVGTHVVYTTKETLAKSTFKKVLQNVKCKNNLKGEISCHS